jgi:hypothetical protein
LSLSKGPAPRVALAAISYEIAAISYEISAISYEISAISYEISAISYEISAISYEISAISYEISAKADVEGASADGQKSPQGRLSMSTEKKKTAKDAKTRDRTVRCTVLSSALLRVLPHKEG